MLATLLNEYGKIKYGLKSKSKEKKSKNIARHLYVIEPLSLSESAKNAKNFQMTVVWFAAVSLCSCDKFLIK